MLLKIIPNTINDMPRIPKPSGRESPRSQMPPSKVKMTSPDCVDSITASCLWFDLTISVALKKQQRCDHSGKKPQHRRIVPSDLQKVPRH